MNEKDELAERYFGIIQKMVRNKCKFCGSTELVYHQYVICDSACQECGEWQNGETI